MKHLMFVPPKRRWASKTQLLVFIGLVAAIGILWLRFSNAATIPTALEAETGTLAGAQIVSDPAASDSKAIQFTANEKFTIVVMPDTQVTTFKWNEDFIADMNWIKVNAASQNIRFVLQVGDVQEWPATLAYFNNARAGFNMLDNVVPYVIAIGNHDFDKWSSGTHAAIALDRSTTIFNTYFPLSKFKTWPSFGDSFPAGSNDNSFHKFSAGGTDWGIITLKYMPTDAELAWADSIAAANPTRRIMVNTHYFLSGNGTRSAVGNNIWEKFAKKHKNINFVFSGHVNPGARRVDPGVNGNLVHQLLSDYQNYSVREPNSYIRVMTFDPAKGSVTVKTYSPALKLFMAGGSDDFVLTGIPFGPIK